MSSGEKPILGYWKIRGLGQPIRFLLEYLGVDYEDKYHFLTENLTKDKWHEEKQKLELDFPNLPYWIDGDIRVSESRAIMRHICRDKRPALLGETDEVQCKIDMVENFIWEFWFMIFIEMLYQHTESYIKTFNETYPVKLGLLSKFIGDSSWCTGEKITYLDFWVYEILYQMKVYDAKILEGYPNLQKLLDSFEKLPAINDYIKSSRYLEKPCFSETAVYQI